MSIHFPNPLTSVDFITCILVSHKIILSRIIRAFLVEEQKIVKKVLKIQKAKEKLASKS